MLSPELEKAIAVQMDENFQFGTPDVDECDSPGMPEITLRMKQKMTPQEKDWFIAVNTVINSLLMKAEDRLARILERK